MTNIRHRSLLLTAALLASLSGCGSITNLTEGPWLHAKHERTTPMGGVALDAQCLAHPFAKSNFSAVSILAFFGGLLDLPLSLAVDLLTLPYTIPKALTSSSDETTVP